jgi:hypothetical protein
MRAVAGLPLAVGLALGLLGASGPGSLPPIVFVSRQPAPAGPGLPIPGLGPHQRALITGGRLLVRERNGQLGELLPAGAFVDVSDPSVSRDARRIAFAGVAAGDSAWRIWMVSLDGTGLRQITFAGRSRRDDDLDPCWIGDSTLCFASTRYAQRAQYADVPATNLFIVSVPAAGATPAEPVRITGERNGAEEPAMDWRHGRILFARWWFNPHRAANAPGGLADAMHVAIPAESVNVWQAMDLTLQTHRSRLAAGDLRTRRGSMGYQPTPLADGSIVAVFAFNLGLSPAPGGTGIHRLPRGFGAATRLAGAIVAGHEGDAYASAAGLAPPSACSPAALPDGRVLFSYSPGARGDFGLYVVRTDGSGLTRVLDLPGTLELDAVPVVVQPEPPAEAALTADDWEDPASPHRGPMPMDGPLLDPTGEAASATFRFHNLDVFEDGPPGTATHGAPPRTPGARIRFYAMHWRPGSMFGDTVVLLREVHVGPAGEVDERGLPAGTPLFEQLVDSTGAVLMTAHGPAHVAGSNAGNAGLATRCVGCHLGHSTLLQNSSRKSRAR